MTMLRRLAWTVFTVWLISSVNIKGCWADLRNVTIDDTFGDSMTGMLPIYTPSNGTAWQHCNATACSRVGGEAPDTSQTVNGTYSVATWSPNAVATEGPGYSVELNFNGSASAVYVYGIMANYIEDVTTLTNLSISLDGEVVGSYVHVPGDYVAFNYSVLVYANHSVTSIDGLHNLTVITVGEPDPSSNADNSIIIFDYALYTINEVNTTNSSSTIFATATSSSQRYSNAQPVPSSSSFMPVGASTRVNAGAIAGGVVGGFFGLLLILFLLLFLYRRRRVSNQGVVPFVMEEPMAFNPASPTSTIPQPFILPPSEGANRPSISRDFSSDTVSTTLAPTSNLTSAAGAIAVKESRAGSGTGPRLLPLPLPLQIARTDTQSISTRSLGSSLPSTRTDDSSDIRQQLMALQTQVERLQAERTQEPVSPNSPTMTEPPPNYEDIHRSS